MENKSEIYKRAEQIFADLDLKESVPDAVEVVIKGLLAERERCAKIADPIDYPNMDDSAIEKQAYDLRETIATAIRRQHGE